MDIKEAIKHCWDKRDYPEIFRDDVGLDILIPGFVTRGSWIIRNSPRVITLEISSYRGISWNGAVEPDELISAYKKAIKSGALFDARCFNIPKEEVTNCILWRQQDATRNSISSAGQAHFSHKQLEGLNSNQIQELLFREKGINWNDYPTKFKRGSCCIKKHHQTLRSHWTIDNEIPIFKGEGREYIEKLIV